MSDHNGVHEEVEIIYSYSNTLYMENQAFLHPKLQPSIILPLLFICLFSIILIVKIFDLKNFFKKQGSKFVYQSYEQTSIEFLNYRNSMTKTCVPFILGSITEVFSYLICLASIRNTHSLGLFLIHQTLILVSDSLIRYSIYLVFDNLQSQFEASDYVLIKTSYFALIMMIVDSFIIVLVLFGSFLMTQTQTMSSGFLPAATLLYVIQISLFILFVGITIRFFFLINRIPTKVSYSIDHFLLEREQKPSNWRTLIRLLVSSMICIIIRSLLRLIKFVSDVKGMKSFSGYKLYYLIESAPTLISCLFLVLSRPEYVLWEISSFVHWSKNKELNTLNPDDLDYEFTTNDIYTQDNIFELQSYCTRH